MRYLLLMITGLAIILLCGHYQNAAPVQQGEYFYSSYLKNSLTNTAWVLLLVSAFCSGYFFKLNPFYSGISLFIVFPITAITEAIVYRGSHNLIPLEFGIYLLYSLPAVLTVYAGKLIAQKRANMMHKKR